jgi:hypothetical protein
MNVLLKSDCETSSADIAERDLGLKVMYGVSKNVIKLPRAIDWMLLEKRCYKTALPLISLHSVRTNRVNCSLPYCEKECT